jgi:hypothetical protein
MTRPAIFELYDRLGFELFDCNIYYDEATQKKKISYPENWKDAIAHFEPPRNAYAIKTGNEYNITAIDIDDMTLEHNIELYNILEPVCNMIAITPRNGRHLLFNYRMIFKTCSDETYKLDIRNDAANLMAEPSFYLKNGTMVQYKWIKTPYGNSLNDIPTEAIELIANKLDSSVYFRSDDDIYHNTPPVGDNKSNIDVKELGKVLEGLNEKRAIDFQYWWKVGAILYNSGQSLSLFDTFSKRAGNRYDKKGVSDHWKTLKSHHGNKKLSVGTLWYWLKEDNPELFSQLRALKKKDESQYVKCKKMFEADHFYCRSTNTIVEVDDNNCVSHFGIEHAQVAFNIPEYNFEVVDPNTGVAKQVQLLNKWLSDPTKLAYKELIFNPNQTVNNDCFNTYKGLPIANVKRGDNVKIQRLLVMIEDVLMNLVNDDPLAFVYVRNWFAYKIQYPGRRIDVAVIISSLFQGIGKDSMGLVMNRIFGKFYSHITDAINNLFGQFNTELEDKLFVHLEEISGFENRKNSNKLKSLITAKNMIINHKGIKTYSKDCYFSFYATTNEACPVMIEEEDRRFFHANAGKRHQNEIAFWTEFYQLVEDDTIIRGVYDYFMAIDLSSWNPRTIYVTQSKETLQENEVVYEKAFLQYLANDSEADEEEFSNDNLYKRFVAWATLQTITPYAKNWFMRKLSPYISLNWIRARKSDANKFKIVDYLKIRETV